MPVIILDPEMEREVRENRAHSDANRYDEVWEGVLVVPPLPSTEHQELAMHLVMPLYVSVYNPGLGRVFQGVNISDRHPNWVENFRCPDICVYLRTNPAIDHGSHWTGSPDFAVEIISPGEEPHAKLGFYAATRTLEVLIVNREPWSLELFRLNGDELKLAATSTVDNNEVLLCHALPLRFQLHSGLGRPRIAVVNATTLQEWLV